MSKIPLNSIISLYIDSADISEHQQRRLRNIAVRGVREFNMDVTGQFKSVLLDVSANGSVAFPDDYQKYSKLGILNSEGEVMTLTHNEDLSTLHQQYLRSQMQIEQVPSAIGAGNIINSPASFPFFWFNYAYGGAFLHLYGLGGGTAQIGQFTVDEDARCFWLQQGWPYSTIMLEYLSDGYDCGCSDYMIDERVSEALIAYIRWKNSQDLRKKFGANEVRFLRSDYYRERNLARLRMAAVNKNELTAVFRRNVKLTARA